MQSQANYINTPIRSAPQNANHENVARLSPGYVYAVLFSDGWVKVGRGRDAQKRINCHISLSAMRGATAVDCRISGKILDSSRAEAALIALCGGYESSVFGREWFDGVDFALLASLIESQFSGDSKEAFSEYSASFAIRAEKAGASFKNAFDRFYPFSKEDAEAWSVAVEHAKVIEQIYLDDCYSGPLFAKEHRGYSSFCLMASLALYKVQAHNVALIYWKAFNEPEQLLPELSAASSKSCTDILLTHDKALKGAA